MWQKLKKKNINNSCKAGQLPRYIGRTISCSSSRIVHKDLHIGFVTPVGLEEAEGIQLAKITFQQSFIVYP